MNKDLTMQNDYMENSTKISLCFNGDEVPLEKITSILEVEPTYVRKKSEWRVQNEYTCDEWEFSIKEKNCPDVEILFRKFMKTWKDKTGKIKKVCQECNCTVYFIIVIHMENCAQPDIVFSPDTIYFLHLINAEVIMDIWGYDTGEGAGYDTGDIRLQHIKDNHMEESVKISLYMEGDEIPLDRITSMLEIEPTILRKKTEWKADHGFSCDEWIFELKKMKEINCPDIEEMFQKFIGIFKQKTETIKSICNNCDCRIRVIVAIHMENSTKPYISMSPYTISFLHNINAELIFHIFGYDIEKEQRYGIPNS